MALAGELLLDFQNTVNFIGEPLRFRKFTRVLNTGSYDDVIALVSGTDTWVSGIIQPIGKGEASLVQQGFLLTNDLKVYVDGSVNVSGIWKLGIGSANPPTGEYSLLDTNVSNAPQINGSIIYHKLFCRKLPLGSLYGE